MQPKIALAYSSNSGDGYLGKGWGISGLSVISRCPRTKAVDNNIKGVDFNQDAYCLDGQRLISIGQYDGGTEYRTQKDNYARVVAYDDNGHGPEYWRVWTKSGLIYEYGHSDDSIVVISDLNNSRSRALADGHGATSWAVNKISDRTTNTNAITFTYNKTGINERYIKNINYPGGQIVFNYSPRIKTIKGYMAGKEFQVTKRLSSVNVMNNANNVRKYLLTYQARNDILSSVTEYAGSTALKTLYFDWLYAQNTSYILQNLGNHADSKFIADIDGDARADFIKKDQDRPTVDMMIDANGDGYLDHLRYYHKWDFNVYISYGSKYGLGDAIEVKRNFGRDSGSMRFDDSQIFFADINGDGAIDMIGAASFGVYVAYGYKNGDGRVNFSDFSKVVNSTRPNERFNPDKPMLLVDLNGDGLPDILHFAYANTQVSYNRNGSFTPFVTMEALENRFSYTGGWRASKNIRTTGDINGDGLQDIIGFADNEVRVALNNGKGFNAPYTAYSGLSIHNGGLKVDKNPRILADMNHDGKVDIVAFENENITIYLSNGTTFVKESTITAMCTAQGWSKEALRTVTDYNGDGIMDIVGIKQDGTAKVYLGQIPDPKITRIHNDSTQDIHITYQALNTGDIYTKGQSKGSNIALTPPMQVVSKIDTDNGIGGTNSVTYKYSGYRFNRLYGVLGFETVEQTDSLTQIHTRMTYSQDFPYIGMLTATAQSYKNEAPFAWSTTVYDYHYHPYSNKIYDIYARIQTQQSLEGVTTTTTTDLSDDGYGNILRMEVSKEDSDARYTTITSNEYGAENSDAWIIGRLTRATVTHQKAGENDIVRTSAFDYYADTGLLKTETIEPDAQMHLSKTYTYDGYGNKIKEKLTGTGIKNTVTTYAYSEAYQGRFLTSVTNALGQTLTKRYDPATGAVTKITDPNGQSVTYTYDAMGKKIRESTPFGETHFIHRYSSSYGALYKVSTWGTATPLSESYYDKLGREVARTVTDMDGHRLTTVKRYNARGELTQQRDPDSAVTEYGYDLYGRRTSVTRPNPSGDGTAVTETITYDGLSTTTLYEGLRKTVSKNALGKRKSVTDARGSDKSSTLTYTYYPDGNLKSTTDAAGNTITMTYDNMGYKKSMRDPDLGYLRYTHDALGRVLSITDAKGQITQMKYDLLGRMTQKYERGYAYLWEYDTRVTGKLSGAYKNRNDGTPMYAKEYYYTQRAELSKVTETMDGTKEFTTAYTYYQNGKLKDLIYPNNLAIRHVYRNGYLKKIEDGSTGGTVYEIDGLDSGGRVANALYENGVIDSYFYNQSGMLSEVSGIDPQNNQILHLTYTYDARGNIKSKKDHLIGYEANHVTGMEERYSYDALNRLEKVTANGVTHYYRYDAIGNLTYKDGLSLYYHTQRAHALSSTSDGRSYRYDANGNMLSDGRMQISYNPANKPVSITANKETTTFAYAADGHRYKKGFNNGFGTTYYVGKLFERSYPTNNANYIDKNFIYFGDKLIKIKERHYNGPVEKPIYKTSFLHTDNLGNVIALTDKTGKIIQRRSYTPFGEIRHLLYKEGVDRANTITTTQMLEESTNRSFTGHEAIEGTSLIHMNGRVYDSSIGRFLSADPYIQAPDDTQSYNRYSYVKNNPINYTDPSGYLFSGLGHWVSHHWREAAAIVAAVAITVATGGGAAPAWASFFGGTFGGAVATGALAGAAGGAIMTGTLSGTLKGALWGAVSAGAAYGVAQVTSSVMGISPQDAHSASFFKAGMSKAAAFKAVAHGLSRAAIARLRYGNMKGAFLSGFVTSGFSVGAGAGYKGAFVMAIVGGTASEIGGGKFANGAWGSAFQYLFNDMMYGVSDPITGDDSGIMNPLYRAVKDGWDALQTGATNFVSGLVTGLKSANSFSTYMGGVMTIASADNAVAIPGAIFWDISAAGTELLLIGLGSQNINASLANSVNGAVIDHISPPGKFGAAANVILKTQTQAQ
jgi:RHS repeat-associated protein